MFLVMKMIHNFENKEGEIIIKKSFPDGIVGFSPIFETRDQALSAYPNSRIVEVKNKV